MTKSFKELKVWQKAHELVLEIYKATNAFPSSENYCIISQIRRSSVSVAANIVEGHIRRSDKDFAHFLNIAEGSLEETKYFLLLSLDLDYLKQVDYNALLGLADEVGKILHGFNKKLSS